MNILRARISRGALLTATLVAVVAMYWVVWANRQAIGDWAKLNGYKPSEEIVALAEATTMTPKGKSLFYINNPQVEDRQAFNDHCSKHFEQSIVLGCFLGNRAGIYLYKVTDPNLKGVKEVTAAHEMLHQAYERLGQKERERIDALLLAYANDKLTDKTIKEQVQLYKESEPEAFANELHSLLGTQVADLPQELEDYYRQYFTDRKAVVTLYNNYQGAFTKLQQQIKDYDADLNFRKQHIGVLEKDLDARKASIETMSGELDSLRQNNPAAYNRAVPTYNAEVDQYNSTLDELRIAIEQYNVIVEARNAIAVQERELQQGLSSRQLPDASQE